MPSDFKRGTDGDFFIGDGQTSIVTGREAVAQFLRTRLQTFTGEWFMNLEYGGIDRDRMFVKAPNLSIVSALRKSHIASVPGVRAISEYTFSLDQATRVATEEFTVLTDEDESITATAVSGGAGSSMIIVFGEMGGIV